MYFSGSWSTDEDTRLSPLYSGGIYFTADGDQNFRASSSVSWSGTDGKTSTQLVLRDITAGTRLLLANRTGVYVDGESFSVGGDGWLLSGATITWEGSLKGSLIDGHDYELYYTVNVFFSTLSDFAGPASGSGWVKLETDYNTDPIADAGEDQVLECAGTSGTSVTLDATGSSDPDGDELSYEWSVPAGSGASLSSTTSATPTGTFPLGPTLVTLTVTDGNGGLSMDDVLITVEDSTPPVLVCTTDAIALWPPNGEMKPVEITVVVSDACLSPSSMSVDCTVQSSEPDDATGDGATANDVDGHAGYLDPVDVTLTYDSTADAYVGIVYLRAERDGSDEGRIYSIVVDVADTSGNAGTASCVVVVPHDKRKTD